MTLDKRKEKQYQFILVTAFDSINLKYNKVNNIYQFLYYNFWKSNS